MNKDKCEQCLNCRYYHKLRKVEKEKDGLWLVEFRDNVEYEMTKHYKVVGKHKNKKQQ